MFSTNLVALHVPGDKAARWVHVPVVHFNVDEGKTMVMWRQYWEDRAETASVTLPNGRKYLIMAPYDRTAYQVSLPIEERLGFRWRGEVLVFAYSVTNGLLVNMRTWQEDRNRAWEVVRRYIVGDVDGTIELEESDATSIYEGYTDSEGMGDADSEGPSGASSEGEWSSNIN